MSGGDGTREDRGRWAGDPKRAILWAVIGNGVGLAALMLVLAGGLNARIDRVNVSIDHLHKSYVRKWVTAEKGVAYRGGC